MHDDGLFGSLLGKSVDYAVGYDPRTLFAVERAPLRVAWAVADVRTFIGADIWNAYELSWLNTRGKPHVALARIVFDAHTPYLIESKSLKLYLYGYSESRFNSVDEVAAQITADLTRVAGGLVSVHVQTAEHVEGQRLAELPGLLLDRLDIDCEAAMPETGWLQTECNADPVEQTLVTRLFKSNCPVTGQPDWASVQIAYEGAPINEAGLLRYLLSFRHRQAFHEQCVEAIFMDILRACQPMRLSVYARYTRRGGLDINPWRTNFTASLPENVRHMRQ